MLRGLYMATSGMDVLQVAMEGVGNNIANVSTPGYKKDTYLMKTFPEMLIIEKGGPVNKVGNLHYRHNRAVGISGIGARITDVKVDYSMGNVYETGDKTDVLLKGPAFFAIEYPGASDPGRILYTRNGAFRVDANGYLVTGGGHQVQGEQGGIYIGEGEQRLTIDREGVVLIDDQRVDKLKLVEFSDMDALYKEADDMFVDENGIGEPAQSTTVIQGFLEGSNVNPVDEMATLINVARAYETTQRIIQTQDELLSKAVNQVGSIR